jgi:hypothetical protein
MFSSITENSASLKETDARRVIWSKFTGQVDINELKNLCTHIRSVDSNPISHQSDTPLIFKFTTLRCHTLKCSGKILQSSLRQIQRKIYKQNATQIIFLYTLPLPNLQIRVYLGLNPQWPKFSTHHETRFEFLTTVLRKNQVLANVTPYFGKYLTTFGLVQHRSWR